ncbi:transglycosylase domain-containing protein [Enterococcus asini]|uniref:transglycosylase domain-containing protein n=1 Tax=Enterococcus asini TaxID=57732 RepID=UPI002891DD2D|nr:transglycosylase domain-containing protein [Enterococcus asini]MDT2756496.1 transglycosylase domain-containing protein [Enterococcus asini]
MPQKRKHKQTGKPTAKSGIFSFNVVLRVLHSLLLVGVSFLIIGGALAAGIGVGYFAYLVEDTKTPTKADLQKTLGNYSETSKLVYADDSNIATIRSDLMRTAVDSKDISDLLKKAIISTEDEYFYEHNGVVPKAVVRALLSEATGFGGGGGSTLTQQLVKQQVLTNETTFKRKANEILLSMEVEKFFSKDEIVTMYLNVSPFGRNNRGQNIAGVQEAAKGIFGKNASEVNLAQAAYIAGLPQSPIVYSPYDNTGQIKENLTAGLQRKDFVLFSMYRAHAITKAEYEEAKAYDLTKDFLPQQAQDNSDHGFLYYTVLGEAKEIVAKQLAAKAKVSDKDYQNEDVQAEYLQKAEDELISGGYTVKSTIDKSIYDAMQQAVATYGYLLDTPAGDTVEVGNVLMENSTGKILGFIGSRDFNSNQNNHAFDTSRPAGSSIKPLLVYGPAIDQGIIGSETLLSDYPTTWKTGDDAGKKVVNATNEGTKTFQSVRDALNVSSNIPAYHVYQELMSEKGQKIGYENYLAKMNFPENSAWYEESAPLGPMDVTTLQQTNGFQTLANGGVYQEGYIIESITDNEGNAIYQHEAKPVQVYSPQAASIMNDLMRDILDAGLTSSFMSTMSNMNWYLSQGDWVGKTGSSDGYKDSWLVVSTPSITISNWSGIENNQVENDQEAGTRTGNYMAYLINQVYAANQDIFGLDQKFELADGVKQVEVATKTGELPGKIQINGREQTVPVQTTTSLWANGEPGKSTYKFGIGGTDENYKDYWSKIYGSTSTTTSSSKSNSNSNKEDTTPSSEDEDDD